MAGNDIGIGPVLATGCPPAPESVLEVAEAMELVCKRDSKMFWSLQCVVKRARPADLGSIVVNLSYLASGASVFGSVRFFFPLERKNKPTRKRQHHPT